MKFFLPEHLSEQFHTERILKSGDRGCVVLLRRRTDGRRLVCKQFAGSGEVYALLQQLRSPHLPRVEQVLTEGERVTVLEEYIGGDSLAELLRGAVLTEAQTVDVTLQLCRGLQLLHSYGVVHRDIKPENVILRGDTAVLMDFDASRVEKPHRSADTQMMGTAGYAAPEQYGFSQTDARSDIFAMGVLMNVMLTGRHPATQLAEGPLGGVIRTCIEVNADRRYPTVTRLMEAIEAAAAPKRKRKARGVLALAAALCGLMLAIGLGSETPAPAESPVVAVEGAATFEETESVLDRDTVNVLQNKRGDKQQVFPTDFRYDLDGDGTQEKYLFGVSFASPVVFYGDVVIDEMVGVYPGDAAGRKVIPCVWRYLPDGSLEVAEDFCRLLTDASVTVHLAENPTGATCGVLDYSHRWPGGIEVRFPPDTIGTWVYTATATLGGETLTAQGSTVVVYQ